MKHILKAVTVGAVALGTLAVAGPANAADHTIRPGDLDLSQTRTAGHVDFRKDGLHVYTDDASSQAKAAGYFAVSGALPDSASLAWIGTSPAPGGNIVFDADNIAGNGNDYNVLVFEGVYGDDLWLTGGSSADAKAADPSGAENGGNGSEWFGTLPEWKAALPDATVYAAGFSLGSGVKGDGVLDTITLGSDTYSFTSEAEAPQQTEADVTGYSTVTRPAKNRVKIVFTSNPQPENTFRGDRLHWVVRADGRVIANLRQGFDDRDVVRTGFPMGTGKHKVTVTKNGDLVRTITVRTGR